MDAVDAAQTSTQDHDLTRHPPRRVREEVRDGVAVIAFSALASSLVALMLIVLTRLVG